MARNQNQKSRDRMSFPRRAWTATSLLGCWIGVVLTQPAIAQITPDATLGNETSVLTPGDNSIDILIQGGAQRDSHLFHSFEQFNVGDGQRVDFANPGGIETIFTRVTGENSPTNILGTLGVDGAANLILLNPNGIVFGENARLDVSGAFRATTADSIIFENGLEFSAANPQTPSPLLTVNVPLGLQFGANPGTIVNQSVAQRDGEVVGLAVQPGQTLSLIGGDVELEGGHLTAPGGKIELGSVFDGEWNLNSPQSSFSDATSSTLGTIQLIEQATVNASGAGGGEILVQGRQVSVRDGSQIQSITLGSQPGANLTINASELVEVVGASPTGFPISSIKTNTIGTGSGGDLTLNTAQLRVQGQGLVSASTFGGGTGGDLTIRASESVELSGSGFEDLQQNIILRALATPEQLAALGVPPFQVSDIEFFGGGLLAATQGNSSAAGRLTIDTNRLVMRNGAIASTPTGGAGRGGDAVINASESVEISGSAFVTGAFQGTTGDAGNLRLNTQRLSLKNGGLLQTITFGQGDGGSLQVNASESVQMDSTPIGALAPTGIFANSIFSTGTGGDITVNTRQMIMRDGAQVGNQTGALTGLGLIPVGGPAGDVVINATDFIEIDGLSPDARFISGPGTTSFSGAPAGDVTVSTQNMIIRNGANISTTTLSAGDGGTLTVNVSDTLELIGTGISTGGGVTVEIPSSLVSSSGRADFPALQATGDAGVLKVNAGQLIIRDGAEVAVNSLGSGDAGTLEIVADLIQLDNQGTINAATDSGQGGNLSLKTQNLLMIQESQITTDAGNTDGGNITIMTDTLVALENSDITANAQQGRGGRVIIIAQGIFGTEFRKKLTPESDITATSELGPEFSGIVDIVIQGIDPSQGLVDFPENFTDTSTLIAIGCAADEGNYFALTGRGGLPANPTQPLVSETVWSDVRNLAVASSPASTAKTENNFQFSRPNPQPQIIEAQGWIVNETGQVELVANLPESFPQSPRYKPKTCSP
ncbi:two-partner secretion domain-containing protein [Coleofasciculus sp. E1-EBD-02]|uniref:two-partner secretion domain-containing protein n=1 Tax=Coleofasciculus sp. E1-EBD-02 TaxID=3068481 RepID=UPI0032F6396C